MKKSTRGIKTLPTCLTSVAEERKSLTKLFRRQPNIIVETHDISISIGNNERHYGSQIGNQTTEQIDNYNEATTKQQDEISNSLNETDSLELVPPDEMDRSIQFYKSKIFPMRKLKHFKLSNET